MALLVCEGKCDKEIADALGKSVLTVKKQLGTIYNKLHVPGRTMLTNLLHNRGTDRTSDSQPVSALHEEAGVEH